MMRVVKSSYLLLTLIVSLGFHSALGAQPPDVEPAKRAAWIRFEGAITPMLEQFLERKLETAREWGADLVVLEIDSPGGMVQPSLAIAGRLRDLEWARTVAYVPREALSGASFVALGCDVILMRRHARLGDAGAIYLDEGAVFRYAPEKLRTDLARQVRDLAEAKGRPPALAEAMVDMDLIVYTVTNKQNGETRFMSEPELEAAGDRDQWEKGQPVFESREGHFFEVSGERAVDLELAAATVAGRQQVLQRYELTEGDVLTLKPTAVDTAVFILNRPIVTGLLFLIGLVALYVEFSAPGISIGGLLAGLCFVLFFWSRFLGGTSGWLEVVLFAAGLAFLAVELFVLPGFGVPGLAGLMLIFFSVMMASQDYVLPHTRGELQATGTTLMVILGSGVLSLAAMMILSRFLGTLPIVSRLILPPSEAAAVAGGPADKVLTPEAAVADDDSLDTVRVRVGDRGVADSPLHPSGKALFGDHYVDVVTEGLFVERGRPIRVLQVSGNRVVVREVEDAAE